MPRAGRSVSTNAGVTHSYDGDGKRLKKSNGMLYWIGTASVVTDASNQDFSTQ